MRTLLILLLLVSGGAWWAIQLEGTPAESQEPTLPVWRRTAEGWQNAAYWYPTPKAEDPPLHPLVVVSLQILLSLIGAVAWYGRAESKVTPASANDHVKRRPRREAA